MTKLLKIAELGEEVLLKKSKPVKNVKDADIQELIDEYDENTFWDELIDRLGDRDFFRCYSKDEIQKMNRKERFGKLYEFIDKWEDEINENGINRLGINKDENTD